MRTTLAWIKRHHLLLLLVVLASGGAGLLALVGGALGVATSTETRALTPYPTTTAVAPLSIPNLAPLAPFILDNPVFSQAILPPAEPDVIGIAPVGIYLPRSGNTQFELAAPTPLPTPLPFPTSPPLPIPVPAEIPTLVPDENRTRSFGGDSCAPAGNPVDGILTQRFHRFHSGIDIGIPLNTPVIATHSGTVTFADWSTVGYGYLVIIQNAEFITYYAHNTSFNVATGDVVGKGSVIAFSGSTGNSTGPHVHYEVRIDDIPVDPLTFEDRGFVSC